MKAMILAAGMGTRLRPLTDTIPKALVEVNGVPLLEIVIQRLKFYGFHEILINVFHCANQIIAFLQEKQHFGLDIRISHEKEQLLDTGGGIKNASWFFDDGNPSLVHNVDILSDLDLGQMCAAHLQSRPLATLAVQKRQGSRYLLFNRENLLCGWKNTATGEIKMARPGRESAFIPLSFSGIHVIEPAIFDLMPPQKVFSIIDTYLHVAVHHHISAFHHDPSVWMDLGKKECLAKAGEILNQMGKDTLSLT